MEYFSELIGFHLINPANRNLANSITLNISRARCSSTKCCVPSCNRELPAELHRIPLKVRYEIMKTKRFFIMQNAKACNFHSDYSVWSTIDIRNEICTFTAAQIEEMVDLLRSDPKQKVKPQGIWCYSNGFNCLLAHLS